ncbi:hypothetical protein PFMC_00603 [Plasmodium falciparum CAMP/Malaysia]|uniref:Uncharacterized protein n=1 Tax=Plasmodium falciparum (isolate Camp / Malaysia) TaxID=5835 RepID=A0A024XFC1_PLAFC|nr:hypothetical protein PFMC_00603 [Plasmodium falciparum CAMP/Malaysia]
MNFLCSKNVVIILIFVLLVSFFLKFASNVYVENRESQIIFYNILLSTHKKKKNKLIFLFLNQKKKKKKILSLKLTNVNIIKMNE